MDNGNYPVPGPGRPPEGALFFENLAHRLLNTAELSQWLNCTQKHVRNLVFRREIPFVKVGRLVRFNVAEIQMWLQERSHK